MNFKKVNTRYNIDMPLIFSTIVLIVFGILFIYSADSSTLHSKNLSVYEKQIVSFIVGCLLFILFFTLNYQTLSLYWVWLYFSSLFLLVLVLFFGVEVHGSRSWFPIFGGFSFQPAEISKILFIFTMASSIERCGKNIRRIPYLILLMLIPIPIILLILLQPDPGTAIVFIPITLFMLLVGGAKIEHLLFIILIGILSLSFALWSSHVVKQVKPFIQNDQIERIFDSSILFKLALTQNHIKQLSYPKLLKNNSKFQSNKKQVDLKIKKLKNFVSDFSIELFVILLIISILSFLFFKKIKEVSLKWLSIIILSLSLGIGLSVAGQLFLKPHHMERLSAILDLDKDPLGTSYHQRQSIIAIGSGGIHGHGWTNGPQNNLNFIPEKTNDFIFAVIGEELGFFQGSLLIFILFFVLLYRGLMISYSSKDSFGTFISIGITSMFFAHIVINLGMAIGLLPVMGLPLPFLSAGGSSLVNNIIAVALLLNISRRRYVY